MQPKTQFIHADPINGLCSAPSRSFISCLAPSEASNPAATMVDSGRPVQIILQATANCTSARQKPGMQIPHSNGSCST